MNTLFLERLVQVTSEEMIDSLRPRSVVLVKNGDPRVFDRRDGDKMVFYYGDVRPTGIVKELKTPRSSVRNIGNQIDFHSSSKDQIRNLTNDYRDYYYERREDLVALGLILN